VSQQICRCNCGYNGGCGGPSSCSDGPDVCRKEHWVTDCDHKWGLEHTHYEAFPGGFSMAKSCVVCGQLKFRHAARALDRTAPNRGA